jgi:hypothetical protein
MPGCARRTDEDPTGDVTSYDHRPRACGRLTTVVTAGEPAVNIVGRLRGVHMEDDQQPRASDTSDNPYRHLPEPVRLADMTTGQSASEPPDPEGGHNTDQDAALRAGG